MGTSVQRAKTDRSRFKRERKQIFKSPLDHAKAHEVVWQQVAPLFEAARNLECKFVYFIGEEGPGPVKIGMAKDPVKRLREMQVGNSRRLRVEYVLIGDRHIEKLLHEFWEEFSIVSENKRGKVDAPPGTEWFRAEIREQLFPILGTASELQIQYADEVVTEAEVDIDRAGWQMNNMEDAVRDAHHEHGFVPVVRHQVRRLAAGAGYITPRRTRVI